MSPQTLSPASAWAIVRDDPARKSRECTCKLPRNADLARLQRLGSGCQTRYVCPVLDKYRRLQGGSQPVSL